MLCSVAQPTTHRLPSITGAPPPHPFALSVAIGCYHYSRIVKIVASSVYVPAVLGYPVFR